MDMDMAVRARRTSVRRIGGSICFALGTAQAQDWPARPVKIVVPFAPGGSADTLARIVGEKLTVRLGQNFLVENRPGAGGLIGSEFVAKAVPDGYTFVVSGVASHVIAPAMSGAAFDPRRPWWSPGTTRARAQAGSSSWR